MAPFAGAMARVAPPMANQADLSSAYWQERGSTTQQHYTGVMPNEWMGEVERTGLHIQQADFGLNKDAHQLPPINNPSGHLRPGNEHASPKPHHATMTTYRPTLANTALPDYAGQLQLLERKLEFVARLPENNGFLLPTEIYRVCQLCKLEVDDAEIRSAMKKCSPDRDQRIFTKEFFRALQAQMKPNRPAYSYQAIGMSGPTVEKFAAQQRIPQHSYRASDLPRLKQGDRGRAVMQRVGRSDEIHPWHKQVRTATSHDHRSPRPRQRCHARMPLLPSRVPDPSSRGGPPTRCCPRARTPGRTAPRHARSSRYPLGAKDRRRTGRSCSAFATRSSPTTARTLASCPRRP